MNSTKRSILFAFYLVMVSLISSCHTRQVKDPQAIDSEYQTDSTKVFSRDLSYYDPNKPEADYKNQFNFPRDLETWYGSLVNKMNRSSIDSMRYSILVNRLKQYPVFVKIPWGEKKEITALTLPYGEYLKYLNTLSPTSNGPCDKEAATIIITGMDELTSRINKTEGKYYVIHALWLTCDHEKKLKLITSVADAHACLEGKARHIVFIDDLTESKIAEASPTSGIKVLDEKSN